MSDPTERKFAIGDRVRVTRNYFAPEQRGAIGRIAEPVGLPLTSGNVWVEFERQALNHGDLEAAEFPPDDLESV